MPMMSSQTTRKPLVLVSSIYHVKVMFNQNLLRQQLRKIVYPYHSLACVKPTMFLL
jgi:hypothetical protein